ncbi:hypothetical protein CPC08DRAFT_823007 [Agrocybe pediades]|nr:hypothetical protein CPC08DRAFT_823007 [Agrocybe pediades]
MSLLDDLESQEALEGMPQPIIPTPPPSASALSHSQNIASGVQDTGYAMNTPTTTNYATTSTQHDDTDDKFATLFNPATPRASPTLFPAPLPANDAMGSKVDQLPRPKAHTRRHSRASSVASEQSDFGAFVSVPAFEDPLTANATFDQEWEQIPEAVPSSTETSSLSSRHDPASSTTMGASSSRSTSRSRNAPPSNTANPTLSFFDQFAQDAKDRSSKTRSLVLDELLLHEDDPLYFLKDQQKNLEETDDFPIPAPDSAKTIVLPSSPPPPPPPAPFDARKTPIIDLHNDLDHDYFRSISKTPQTQAHKHGPLHSTPSRSSSFAVAEPRLAPPIASPEGATGTTGSHPHDSSDVLTHQLTVSPPPMEDEDQHQQSLLSSSISSLPGGKWVSTLLRGTSPPTSDQHHSARPALESIFHDPSSSDNKRRSTSPSPARQRVQPNFTHTSAFAPPVASTSAHNPSPFAPHVYVPPSGAPGYTGEGYGWDKGFSDELEAEREREKGSVRERGRERDARKEQVKANTLPAYSRGESPETTTTTTTPSKSGWGSGFSFWNNGKTKASSGSITSSPSSSTFFSDHARAASDQPRSSPSSASGFTTSTMRDRIRNDNGSQAQLTAADVPGLPPPPSASDDAGLGAFIEKKSGNVELVGRKAMTSPVLTPELAGEIRPHLPALSRLPRSWNLIYSLDQHGISLNTLYTLCEKHITRKPGIGEVVTNRSAMLFVVKDAEGGVFGAWLAEGIRPSRGKGYAGGGES